MIRHIIQCQTCARTEIHGSAAPPVVDSCHTSRIMRAACREGMGCCRFVAVSEEWEPTDVDTLRLGMRDDNAISYSAPAGASCDSEHHAETLKV